MIIANVAVIIAPHQMKKLPKNERGTRIQNSNFKQEMQSGVFRLD